MAREIADTVMTGDFPPMVGLRTKGNYVKGKVLGISQTANGNPVATLELIDLEGTSSKSVSKGVYEEVEVGVGDSVQLVGNVKQLREKIPQLAINDIATVTFIGKKVLQGGKTLNQFKVEVE